MFQILLSLALAAPFEAQTFEARTLDGRTAAGELSALDSRELVLETDTGPVSFPLGKLATLAPRPAAAPAPVAAPMWVELMDGSGLAATGYTVAKGKATITADDETYEVPTSAIRWVRFVAADEFDARLSQQWTDITETKAVGDLLVVRKDDALDYLEGVVRDIDADTCKFELDGDVIPVKRTKLTGLVYVHPQQPELAEPVGMVVVADGSRLQIQRVELADGKLKLETPLGTSHEVPLEDVIRFDFSSGKIAFLSDLEPESAEYTPLVGFDRPPQGLLEFYTYRRDTGFERNPLRLAGREFHKGLALASRTALVYKLPDRFRLFRATAGIDDATRDTGSVRLEISGDGRRLWQGDVRGTDPPQDLELDIAGVKRLEILVDYGDGLDVGDRLDLGDAQVTK